MRQSTTPAASSEIAQTPTLGERIFGVLKQAVNTVREGGEGLANFFRDRTGLVLAGALALGVVGCDSKDGTKTESTSTSGATDASSSGDSISSTSAPSATDTDPTNDTEEITSTGDTGSATVNDTSTTDPTTGNVSATGTETTSSPSCGFEGLECINGTCEGEICKCNDCWAGDNCYDACSPEPECVNNGTEANPKCELIKINPPILENDPGPGEALPVNMKDFPINGKGEIGMDIVEYNEDGGTWKDIKTVPGSTYDAGTGDFTLQASIALPNADLHTFCFRLKKGKATGEIASINYIRLQ